MESNEFKLKVYESMDEIKEKYSLIFLNSSVYKWRDAYGDINDMEDMKTEYLKRCESITKKSMPIKRIPFSLICNILNEDINNYNEEFTREIVAYTCGLINKDLIKKLDEIQEELKCRRK